MRIDILHYLEGARKARGLAVIIDVFRAFSTACYVYDAGAEAIILAGTPEEALAIRRGRPDYILIGERGGMIAEGFDYGNSPSALMRADLAGRTAVLATSAGTMGAAAASEAREVITGSFVNVTAVTEYIRKANPGIVSLVSMGWNGIEPADEDRLCAEFIRGKLKGNPPSMDEIQNYLRRSSKTKSFMDLKNEASAPPGDFDFCMSPDRFSFILRAEEKLLKRIYL